MPGIRSENGFVRTHCIHNVLDGPVAEFEIEILFLLGPKPAWITLL